MSSHNALGDETLQEDLDFLFSEANSALNEDLEFILESTNSARYNEQDQHSKLVPQVSVAIQLEARKVPCLFISLPHELTSFALR